MVVVRLPGPVDVVDGAGNVWPPASPIRRTLLALLALRPGEVVSGDWLLDHAWNAEPRESGLRAARFHISQLRQELGVDDLIETRQGGYRLAVAADQVDALAVEKMASAACQLADPQVAAARLGDVLAQWRGTPSWMLLRAQRWTTRPVVSRRCDGRSSRTNSGCASRPERDASSSPICHVRLLGNLCVSRCGRA